MFVGERVGERLIKGILSMWVCCVSTKFTQKTAAQTYFTNRKPLLP